MLKQITVTLLACIFLSACETAAERGDVETQDKGRPVDAVDQPDGAEVTTLGAGDQGRADISALDAPQQVDPELSIRTIYFEFDSSDIRFEDRAAIAAHAAHLVANPDIVITLEGHADERGSREYNLALGERRAQAVQRQMSVLGTPSAQLRNISYGEERPKIDGHDEDAWHQNRRVEIIY